MEHDAIWWYIMIKKKHKSQKAAQQCLLQFLQLENLAQS